MVVIHEATYTLHLDESRIMPKFTFHERACYIFMVRYYAIPIDIISAQYWV